MANKHIKQQFFYAIDKRYSVGQGRSKHNDKKNKTNEQKDVIYSRNEYKRLKDVVQDLAGFTDKNFPELRKSKIEDFPSEVIEDFLESKKETCTQNTINGYFNSLKKAYRCADRVYKIDTTDIKFIKIPTSKINAEDYGRNIRPATELMDGVIGILQPSRSRDAIELARRFGLRVEETTKIQARDINLENNTLFVKETKAGKPRTLPITEEDLPLLTRLKKGKRPEGRVCPITPGAVNQTLARGWTYYDKANRTNVSKDFKDHKTSIHAARKLKATELYEKKAEDYTKELLKQKIKEKLQMDSVLKELAIDTTGKKSNASGLDYSGIKTEADLEKFIEENYEKLKEELVDKSEEKEIKHNAWRDVSIYLGHGGERQDLFNVYIIQDKSKIIQAAS